MTLLAPTETDSGYAKCQAIWLTAQSVSNLARQTPAKIQVLTQVAIAALLMGGRAQVLARQAIGHRAPVMCAVLFYF